VEDLSVARNTRLAGTLAVQANASFATTLEARNASIYYLNVSGNTDMMGRLTVKENVSMADTLDVRNVSIVEDLNINRNAFIKGSMVVDFNASFGTTVQARNVSIQEDLIVYRATELVGTLLAKGSTTFDREVTLNNRLNVNNVSVTQDLHVTGLTTLRGNVSIENNATMNTLYVIGESRHNNLICNTSAVIQGPLNVTQLTTLGELTSTNASFNMILVNQNASFNNNLYVQNNVSVDGALVVQGSITGNGTAKFTTLIYDTLQATNTTAVNQVVNQLTIQNYYSPIDANPQTTVNGNLVISVPTVITQDIDNTRINGITFTDNTVLEMSSGTSIVMKPNSTLKLETGANATFDDGSVVFFNCSTTTFKNITLNGRIITTSDRKLKKNIQPLMDTLDQVKHIHGHRYQRIDEDTDRVQIGLIAQDVEQTYPELVSEEGGTKRVDYISFIAVLLGCIQELESRVVLLENKI
jgi:hypothetical protein